MQYIKQTLLLVFSWLMIIGMVLPSSVNAAIPEGCPGSANPKTPPPSICGTIPAGCPGSTQLGPPNPNTPCPDEGGGTTSSTSNIKGDCKTKAGEDLTKENCAIVAYIVSFTRVLSGLVGIVIAIMITVGGIQYAAAGPDPGAVTAAKKRIMNAIIALVLYVFMFSFLQWLVPGGIF